MSWYASTYLANDNLRVIIGWVLWYAHRNIWINFVQSSSHDAIFFLHLLRCFFPEFWATIKFNFKNNKGYVFFFRVSGMFRRKLYLSSINSLICVRTFNGSHSFFRLNIVIFFWKPNMFSDSVKLEVTLIVVIFSCCFIDLPLPFEH